jgi:hypothetical protein
MFFVRNNLKVSIHEYDNRNKLKLYGMLTFPNLLNTEIKLLNLCKKRNLSPAPCQIFMEKRLSALQLKNFKFCAMGLWVLRPLLAYCTSPG